MQFLPIALIKWDWHCRMAEYHTNMKLLAVMIFSAAVTLVTQNMYSSVQVLGQEENGEPGIPQATCIYGGHQYYLTPHIYNDGEKSSRIDFPDFFGVPKSCLRSICFVHLSWERRLRSL